MGRGKRAMGTAASPGGAGAALYQGPIPEITDSWQAPAGYSLLRRPDGQLLLIERRPFGGAGASFVESRSVFADEDELRQAVARREAKTVVSDAELDALVLARLHDAGPEIAAAITTRLADHGYFAGETRSSQSRVSRSLQRLQIQGLAGFVGSRWTALAVDTAAIAAPAVDLDPYERRYHVPRSQVWAGSRGAQSGHTHLHVKDAFDLGRIHRTKGQALCGKSGWYERPPDPYELDDLCPRCLAIAIRVR